MSFEYDTYLQKYKGAVADGFYWMRDNIPEVLRDPEKYNYEHQICFAHDASKSEADEGEVVMDMPYNYIVEMICDWWAVSHMKGDLTEIFKWYDEHADYLKLSDNTRKEVEWILGKMREKLLPEESNVAD